MSKVFIVASDLIGKFFNGNLEQRNLLGKNARKSPESGEKNAARLGFCGKYCYTSSIIILGSIMFESIEIRRAANGFILVITTEEETREYVYDTSRKALRVIKELLENNKNQ